MADESQQIGALLTEDPSGSILLSGDWLDRLATIHADDYPGWAKIASVLRHQRILRLVEARVKERSHELKQVKRIGGAAKPSQAFVVEIWPGAPVPSMAVVPDGWRFSEYSPVIHRVEPRMTENGGFADKLYKVSYDPILITKRIQHRDRGSVMLELSWRIGERWHSDTFEREVVFSARDIVKALARRGAPVRTDNAAEMIMYLGAYEHENRAEIPIGYATSRMGWQGDDDDPTKHGFMCGTRQFGGNGKAIELSMGDGDRAEATAIRSHGSFAEWKRAISPIERWPLIQFAIYAALAPPLLAILDAPNCAIEWAGRTSRGKTTALKIAQSCWRKGTAEVPTWNATINGIEAVAATLSDLPLIIDDTTTAPDIRGGTTIGKTIYHITSGHSKTRGERDGGKRQDRTWRTVLMTTGEVPSSDLTRAEGAAARVLTFWGDPLGKTTPQTGSVAARLIDDLGDHYGWAGPMLVEWLCNNRDKWDALRSEYKEAKAAVMRTYDKPAAARLAPAIALLEITARLADHVLGLPWTLGRAEAVDALGKAIEMASNAADRARQAWDYVLSYAESRPSQWISWGSMPDLEDEPYGGWLGWWSSDVLAWHPTQLKRALDDGAFAVEATLRAWRDAGILDVGTGQRTSGMVRCGHPEAGAERLTAHRTCPVKRLERAWEIDRI